MGPHHKMIKLKHLDELKAMLKSASGYDKGPGDLLNEKTKVKTS
jgi:hypothetical protein